MVELKSGYDIGEVVAKDPLVVVIDDFTTETERSHIIKLARRNLASAKVATEGDNAYSEKRTGSVAWVKHNQTPVVRNLVRRVSDLMVRGPGLFTQELECGPEQLRGRVVCRGVACFATSPQIETRQHASFLDVLDTAGPLVQVVDHCEQVVVCRMTVASRQHEAANTEVQRAACARVDRLVGCLLYSIVQEPVRGLAGQDRCG